MSESMTCAAAGVGINVCVSKIPLENIEMSLVRAVAGNMWMSRRCAYWLCPSLDAVLWRDDPNLSLVATLGRAGSAPCLGNAVELVLVTKAWVTSPKGVRVAELGQPLTCCST